MGLDIPDDLGQWREWNRRRRVLGRLPRSLRPKPSQSVWVASNSDQPVVGAVVERRGTSTQAALLEPLAHLSDLPLAVFTNFAPDALVPDDWQVRQVNQLYLGRDFMSGKVLLASGHSSPLGNTAYIQARQRGVEFVVVQQGLLTPKAPPLPAGAKLLAWSAEDADFWLSGRGDVQAAVAGPQLLWQAARRPVERDVSDRSPVFLGQLHGGELSRTGMSRAALIFCRNTRGAYRPHPYETDHGSQLQHAAFEGFGIDVDRSQIPLDRVNRPVASAFSTGVLEAAARAIPAFVYYPKPPRWLEEFWDRYQLQRWGTTPTPPPSLPATEPAQTVAATVRALVEA